MRIITINKTKLDGYPDLTLNTILNNDLNEGQNIFNLSKSVKSGLTSLLKISEAINLGKLSIDEVSVDLVNSSFIGSINVFSHKSVNKLIDAFTSVYSDYGKFEVIPTILKLYESIGVSIDYIGYNTDSSYLHELEYCNKRMTRWFPNMLTRVNRSTYVNLRSVNKNLAIRSFNSFYVNKFYYEAVIRNSVP